MKFFKSIKWRLQLWYGLILLVVLSGFGFTSYQLERSRQFRRIDDEIHRRVGVLGNALHRPPPHRSEPRDQRFDRPPGEQRPDDGPPGQHFHPDTEFRLPEQDAHFFEANDPNQFFFSILGPDGGEIGASTNRPAQLEGRSRAIPGAEHDVSVAEANIHKMLTLDALRLTAEKLPSGETIWVGCSIAPELKELRLSALRFLGVGGVVLILGLAGGWWFVRRALLPIENISSTATKISAGDLSQRINTDEAESELGQLAAVLNSTFARLEAAFAQQKQFASDAAHELRTPVTVILTQTQMALGRERDAAAYKQTVEACQRAAQRMRKLIESLLELARFDAGQEVLKQLRFDFANVVNDSIEMVQTLADERRVKIMADLAPLEMTGDSERLAQVVTNLLTNAIQYNNPEGEVRLKLEAQAGLAVLTIADTGRGIASADLPRVFERFYRADPSRTGAGNSGLGLSICKAIVEAHGGTIEVASMSGAGTTFTLRLPVNS